jgi:hypothetical protein
MNDIARRREKRHQGYKKTEERPCEDSEKPKRETSGETNSADTLILDFQPPELQENIFLFLIPTPTPTSLECFIMGALES